MLSCSGRCTQMEHWTRYDTTVVSCMCLRTFTRVSWDDRGGEGGIWNRVKGCHSLKNLLKISFLASKEICGMALHVETDYVWT